KSRIFSSHLARSMPGCARSCSTSGASAGSARSISFSCSPTHHGADPCLCFCCWAPMAASAVCNFSMLQSLLYVLGEAPAVWAGKALDEQPAAVDVVPLEFAHSGALDLYRLDRAVLVGDEKIRGVVRGRQAQAAVGIRRVER